MTNELHKLYQDRRIANEGLAQMQAPGAGYEDDPEQLQRDVAAQLAFIERLEKKIGHLKKAEA